MKKIIGFLLLMLGVSSCSMSVYMVNKGQLKLAQRENYQVTYQVDLPAPLKGTISYTDVNGATKLKDVTGIWQEHVQLQKGSKVNFKLDAKGEKATGTCKIWVDDQVIVQHILTNRKLKFNVNFILP